MKLIDILPPTPKATKRKDASLIINLKKIKYEELQSISFVLDDSLVLSTAVKGWYPIHYASLNSDYRVLEMLIDLYNKHQVDLNQRTTTYKESIPENATAMDAVYIKSEYHFNFLTLYKHHLKPEYLYENGSIYSLNDRYRYSSSQDKEFIRPCSLPYPDNLITPAFYSHEYNTKLISFFLHEKYDEKKQLLLELKDNLMALSLYGVMHKEFSLIERKIGKLLPNNTNYSALKEEGEGEDILEKKPKIKKSKEIADYLSLFFIPLFSLVENASQGLPQFHISFHSSFLILENLENNGYPILDILLEDNDLYNEFEKYHMQCKSLDGKISGKEFQKCLAYFNDISKTVLAIKLENELMTNAITTSRPKL